MQVWPVPKVAVSHSDDVCSVLISCVLLRRQNALPATFMLDETQLVRSRTSRSREKMSSVQYSCKLFPYSIEMNQHPLREHQQFRYISTTRNILHSHRILRLLCSKNHGCHSFLTCNKIKLKGF